jgi:catechol 2,3-dioxygenase-like lactoylglutathione lyase family enzyme
MSDTATFQSIRCVAVPVTDLDRSKSLFEDLGFTCRFDAELRPDFRWIELTPDPDGTAIALVQTGPDLPVGIDTGIRLVTPDARAAHERVHGLGLDAGDLLDWPGVPLMFSFTDPDGNRFYTSEPDT